MFNNIMKILPVLAVLCLPAYAAEVNEYYPYEVTDSTGCEEIGCIDSKYCVVVYGNPERSIYDPKWCDGEREEGEDLIILDDEEYDNLLILEE